MEYIGTYGNYSYNTSQSYVKSRASKWSANGVIFYKSYDTIIAFKTMDNLLKVCENCWSSTTGKHLNWLDGGNKKNRLDRETFQKELAKVKPKESNPLALLGMVSALGDIMTDNKKESNKWKERFIMKQEGIIKPDDWNELTEQEKEKRLNGVIDIALDK